MTFSVVNDTIVPTGGDYSQLTPREATVRNAMLVVTLAAPVLGSFIIWLFSAKGWSYASTWTFSRLAIMWFWSVSLFGGLVFYQTGKTNRFTFIIAVFHTSIEVLINSLYLHLNFRQALKLAGLWGLLLFTTTLASETIVGVFYWVATFGGAGDTLPVFLLAYGKKWWYALGALGHMIGAVLVFTDAAIFFNVVTFNVLTFLALWTHVGATVIAILNDSPVKDTTDNIQLPLTSDEIQVVSSPSPKKEQWPSNPLWDVFIPKKMLAIMIGASLAGAFGISNVINYLATPKPTP
ncbi:hypothetical protein AX16_004449 [Volvariella volvacea WC 439]|nr:hypothetical protein AX16_004449 [Volvariella volvacea WC 439]